MIQLINHPRAAGADARQIPTDAPEEWGKWSGRKHYSLQVIQHPLRARMCGFGDKDRRPLAPAAVAKMIVRRDDNSLVDVDDVDCSFFVVTVDLWSANGTQEMNLVLHPSSADRYIPPHTAKPRRRGTSVSTSAQQRGTVTPGYQTPASRSTPTPHYRPETANYTSDNSGYFSQSDVPFTATQPSSESGHPTWGYPSSDSPSYPPPPIPPMLPSIQTFNGSEPPTPQQQQPDLSYRPWSETTSSFPPPPTHPPSSATSTSSDFWSPTSQPEYDPYGGGGGYPQPSQPSHQAYYQSPSQPPLVGGGTNPSNLGALGVLPRHTYTRTLVGPLSANATRLLDEHRKPGIFFLFQDLSVRTEGTFRLRMRLMNVGAPPAPESGAFRIHTDVSPVLAQTFTEPFTVYSAKRFPGVPDTTALSIAFGNQGQKLPLRNRNASSSGKRRRRDGSSDEDSDE